MLTLSVEKTGMHCFVSESKIGVLLLTQYFYGQFLLREEDFYFEFLQRLPNVTLQNNAP